jgi:kynurenine formamidase
MEIGMPSDPSHPPYFFTPYYRLGDFELDGGYGGSNELIIMSGHSATHLDSLSHVACNGVIFGGKTMTEGQDGVNGITENAIDSVAPIIRRGVLLNVAASQGVAALAPGRAIDAADLEATAEHAGVDVREGDCVLVRTGFGAYWSEPERFLGVDTGIPGVDLDGAEWLTSRGVFLAGSDTSLFEHAPLGYTELPVHLHLLTKSGVYIMENLNLETVAAEGLTEFTLVVLPLLLAGSSGSPVRAIAVTPALAS